MNKIISIADYQAKIGTELGVSDWIEISQERINVFAETTGDHQFIHVNPELAKQTPYGTTVAHGLLTLSLLPNFAYQVMPFIEGTTWGVNYGYNRVRFMAPVKSGKRVRGRLTLKAIDDSKPNQLMSTVEVTVEIEDETKPALVAEWLTLTFQ